MTSSKRSTQTRDQAYKGYLIARNPFDGLFRVAKDGFHICTTTSIAGAKSEINLLTDQVA